MDNQIKDLIETCQGRQLSDREREMFEDVSFGVLMNKMINYFPGESPIPRSINPETGKVVFSDSYGTQTIPLINLGYELKGQKYSHS